MPKGPNPLATIGNGATLKQRRIKVLVIVDDATNRVPDYNYPDVDLTERIARVLTLTLTKGKVEFTPALLDVPTEIGSDQVYQIFGT
jgi:hypothetical protein